MSPRYAPITGSWSTQAAEREMEDAFKSDNEEDDEQAHESTPLNGKTQSSESPSREEETSHIPGAYDFEREYDYPPPGSPPRPSSRALPNDFGNSNGTIPNSPIRVNKPSPSLFRRAVGALLPTHYVAVPTEAPVLPRTVGGGIENDGVFANVTAKPQAARVFRTEDGETHMVPEETQKETPPSYVEAQADAVPPYWETTVHAPAELEPGADMIIDDLPTGSFLVFCLNTFVSFFFQFVGFFLTYLLHTSHAAKYGSRAGLGLTLIQYGLYSRTGSIYNDDNTNNTDTTEGETWSTRMWNGADQNMTAPSPADQDTNLALLEVSSRDWLAFLFMTLGWFLLLSSIMGFWRIKRWEKSIRAPVPHTREDYERDAAVRHNLAAMLGLPPTEDVEQRPRILRVRAEDGGVTVVGHAGTEEPSSDEAFRQSLRRAGLI